MNEEDQFLQEQENILEQPIEDENVTPSVEEESPEESPEETEIKARNRREKRLAAKLQAEREAGIAMAARLEAITEAKRDSEGDDYLKAVDRIYGTDTPEAAAATDLLKTALRGAEERARDSALATFREEQQQVAQAVQAEEASLDSMIDDIEDQYGVSMTAAEEKGFFQLLERFSPKDRDGNILSYADPFGVFEEYQKMLKKPRESRAKDMASRSMTRSGSSADTKVDQSANEKWLKEQGIL